MPESGKVLVIKGLFLLLLSSGLMSCVSLNSHQSGRTVGKGDYSVFGNVNFGKFDSEQYFTLRDSGLFYIAEVGKFHGLKENFDFGYKINSSLHMTVMGKYQFIGDQYSTFASSIGLDIGGAPFGAVMGAVSYSSTLSLYNSFHPTDHIVVTFTPRYTYLGFRNFTKEHGFTRRNRIYGYSAGLMFGEMHQLSLELSQYVNNERFSFENTPIFSVGYIWNL